MQVAFYSRKDQLSLERHQDSSLALRRIKRIDCQMTIITVLLTYDIPSSFFACPIGAIDL